MNEQTHQKINQRIALAIQVTGYLLIVGFALSGVAIILISLLTWVVSDFNLIGGFGLITGGLVASCATTLLIGKLIKDGDGLQLRLAKKLT